MGGILLGGCESILLSVNFIPPRLSSIEARTISDRRLCATPNDLRAKPRSDKDRQARHGLVHAQRNRQ